MSSRVKKHRNRLARQVLNGKLTVDEARSRLGREIARGRGRQGRTEPPGISQGLAAVAAAVKSAGPVTEQDLINAVSMPLMPLMQPSVTKTAKVTKAAKARQAEDQRQLLAAVKSAAAYPVAAPGSLIPASSLTGAQRAVLRAAYEDPDPVYREACRAHLESTVGRIVA